MERTISIEDYIPFGRENAVSYNDLVMETGLTPREVRRAIQASDACILNLQDGKGFWRFDPVSKAERAFAEKYSAQEKARGWSCIKKALKVDRMLNQTEPDTFNGNLYRMARLLKGITVEDVALELNCSFSKVRRVESGTLYYNKLEAERFDRLMGFKVKE